MNSTQIIEPNAVYKVQDIIKLLQIPADVKFPDRVIERLFRTKQLRGRIVSRKTGYQTTGQAVIDYLMIR